MASPQYSVEELIENIKRRCSVPTSQLTYEPADFAALATDELQGEVVPLIMSTREEYFVDYVDVTVGSGGVIEIPNNSVGSKLRSVALVRQTNPLILNNLPRIDLDVVAGVGISAYSAYAGFYVQGNELILYPSNAVPANSTIRLSYYKRTLVLAEPEKYGRVVSIDVDSSTVVLNNVPLDWTVGTKLNSVYSKAPFNLTNEEMTITAVSSPSVVLDTVEGIEVGDYISELGFSAIPQIPVEAHAYLAQLTAIKCLEGLGDKEGMQAAQAKADILKKNLLVMISQRVDGSVKKVVNPNGGLRFGAALWRRGFGRY